MSADLLVQMEGIDKSFPGVQALAEPGSSCAPARSTRWWARTALASPRS